MIEVRKSEREGGREGGTYLDEVGVVNKFASVLLGDRQDEADVGTDLKE